MLLKQIEELRTKNDYIVLLEDYLNEFLLSIEITAKNIQNSNAIEGSTFSLGDTLSLLKDNDIKIDGKSEREHLEVLSLRDANSYLEETSYDALELFDILEMHTILMKRINPSIAGMYRVKPAYTRVDSNDGTWKTHEYEEFQNIPPMMASLTSREVSKLHDIVMYKLDFAQIHPFTDGNGRVSRLILNWLLIQNDYPPIIIKGDTKESRKEYIDAMADYSVNRNPNKFINLVYREVYNTIKGWYN